MSSAKIDIRSRTVTCGIGPKIRAAPELPSRFDGLSGENRTSLPFQAGVLGSGLSRKACVADIQPSRATLESIRTCAKCRDGAEE